MSSKKLESLLQKLSDTSSELENSLEPLTDDGAEEIAGGTDINVACPGNGDANTACSNGPK